MQLTLLSSAGEATFDGLSDGEWSFFVIAQDAIGAAWLQVTRAGDALVEIPADPPR